MGLEKKGGPKMRGLTYNDVYVNLQDDLSVNPPEVEKALVKVWSIENAVGQDMNAKNDTLPQGEMNTGDWYYEQLPDGRVQLRGKTATFLLNKEGAGIVVRVKHNSGFEK